ncbi:FHA domain-containing protein [Prevotella nigrescens]|jgi:FHA domain protein|uniref:FHA domain-containing protein n=2 Tax=Prevotella nigrescens TaxID=28133 RepID=UPI001CB49A02|nr:FHA domain-containing protein [Prevotella nigrescens]MBF1444598.1 FHA domain-containing protein [Prevotella nigrescens]
MKKIRCPKCKNFIIFDEKKYTVGQRLSFCCPACRKQFGIKYGASSNKNTQALDEPSEEINSNSYEYGSLYVIENVFHYKQILPLQLGKNIIGRYMKGNPINCPIETDDPSIDMTHCCINVTRNKKGVLEYELKDGPSYTGTFVDNEILEDNERRKISNGTLFTIGATSIILRTKEE